MSQRKSTRDLVITSLLTALGILIPTIMPIKIVVGPASYTLGSHFPTMMAMFRSPAVAAVVALGTTLGFFISGLPFVIAMRALTHVIFATLGAYYLQKHKDTLTTVASRFTFSLVLNIIHAVAEMVVVYIITGIGVEFTREFFTFLFVLVGVGTLIHGMIDFELSYHFTRALDKRARVKFAQVEV